MYFLSSGVKGLYPDIQGFKYLNIHRSGAGGGGGGGFRDFRHSKQSSQGPVLQSLISLIPD